MTVRALKHLKFKTSKGIVEIRAGQVFRPADPVRLIRAGLVKPVIEKPWWQRPDGSCYACGSREAWRNEYKLTCNRCHPPGNPDDVVEWITGTA